MRKIKVLITDPLVKAGVEIFKKAGFHVDEVGKTDPAKLSGIIGSYDVLIVRSGTKVPADVIRHGKKLKIIGRAGVGLDNVDVAEATYNGIIVMNAPEGNTISAAEHAVGLMFSLARNIPQANWSVKEHLWEKKQFMGTELYGKVMGVIGFGRIGRRVAAIAKSLGMKVLCYDPYVLEEEARRVDVSLVTLEGLCSQSDVISLHIPFAKETKHLLSDKEFSLMKEGVMIINCARGGIVDEKALYKYIVNGKVKGAALDVFEKEPPAGNPLLKLKQVVATPHLGASTMEAQVSVACGLATQIVDALVKKVIRNAINLPTLDESLVKKFGKYLGLGEKLGLLARQLVDGDKVDEICINFSGEIVDYDLSLLRNHILKGVLHTENRINVVNAPLILKEKGIRLKEKKDKESGEFLNLIEVSVKSENIASVGGTIFQNGEPRIVKVDDFSVEAVPKGFLLICRNIDKPGVMGHVGTVLGKRGRNIALMTLGRKRKGGLAITLLNLDEAIDEDIIKEIKEFPLIHSVKLVKL